jgi:hypothetical protein
MPLLGSDTADMGYSDLSFALEPRSNSLSVTVLGWLRRMSQRLHAASWVSHGSVKTCA